MKTLSLAKTLNFTFLLCVVVNFSALLPAAEPAGKVRVLIVTGEDYPGHLWQLTTPVLKTQLEKNSGLQVDVLDDLTKLTSTKLDDYAAIVLHFKNYNPNVPPRVWLDQLDQYVQNGGGLVLVHFACGAFQEHKKAFGKLAGRVWNPELRGHDPHGEFRLDITDIKHSITAGMDGFETTDELYTCVEGDAPITVLATAVSKVDNKTYPIAFVLDRGKGHVFHCLLGHDVAALENPSVGDLYRRGTLWTVGINNNQEVSR